MYVLLGPQQQVETPPTASDVAAFFISNRANVSEWLIFRQMDMPDLTGQSTERARQLLAFLMLEESIREQSMQAVRDNFPGVL